MWLIIKNKCIRIAKGGNKINRKVGDNVTENLSFKNSKTWE